MVNFSQQFGASCLVRESDLFQKDGACFISFLPLLTATSTAKFFQSSALLAKLSSFLALFISFFHPFASKAARYKFVISAFYSFAVLV